MIQPLIVCILQVLVCVCVCVCAAMNENCYSSAVSRRTARLEIHQKIRTTPSWKTILKCAGPKIWRKMRCTRSEGLHTNKTSNGGQQEEDFGEMCVTPQTVVCAMDGFRRRRTSLFSLLDGCLPVSTARAWFFGLPCVNSPARRRKPDGTFLGFTSIPFEPSEIGDPGKKGLSSSFAAEVSFFPRNCRPSKSFKPFCAVFVEPFYINGIPFTAAA